MYMYRFMCDTVYKHALYITHVLIHSRHILYTFCS